MHVGPTSPPLPIQLSGSHPHCENEILTDTREGTVLDIEVPLKSAQEARVVDNLHWGSVPSGLCDER